MDLSFINLIFISLLILFFYLVLSITYVFPYIVCIARASCVLHDIVSNLADMIGVTQWQYQILT